MATVRRAIGLLLVVVVAILLFGAGWMTGRLCVGSVVEPASMAEAERQFAERMRNVKLVGSFTVDGLEPRPPRSDGYEISSVEKVGDDLWRFNARIGLREGTAVIPVVVPMRWVGDTPVIMMTNTSLPGLGTFSVRLFFYEDRYAGTWQHGEVGGQMSGRIERQAGS